MMRVLRIWLAIIAVIFGLNAFAQDATAPTNAGIPYKTEATPLETNGSRVGWSMLGLLGVAAFVVLILRKQKLPLPGRKETEGHLKVLDRTRLNPRTMLYVVNFGQKKLLIGQSGDQLVRLAEADAAQNQEHGDA